MLKYLNTKNKHKLFFHLCRKWAWPKQLAKKLSDTVGIIEVIKKLETARTPASLAATDAGTRWT